MLTGIHHVAYVVPHMDSAIRFIENSMKLTLRRRERLRNFEMAVFTVGGSTVELISPYAHHKGYTEFLQRTGGGLNHVAFASDSLESDAARLVEGGSGFEKIYLADTGWRITNVDSNDALGMKLQLVDMNTQA